MKTLPQVFYGMHFFPGCAEYREPGREPYRIYIGEEAIKNMNASFAGKPVFVDHRDEVNLETLEQDADGYVVESFYLPCDGKTWVKFIVTSDKGHQAINMGWSLSNSYVIKERGPAGMNHGIDYQAEVLRGEYDHLAIVQNPRYEQSIILTPVQFQEYVAKKELELAKVANSADTEDTGEKPVLSFFKKTKVDNSAELENTVVQLPKSKRELSITQLVNEMDEYTLKMPLPKMANDDDYVEMNGNRVNVKDMKDCYNTMMAMKEEEEKKNAEKAALEEEAKKKENAEEPKKEEKEEPKKENESAEAKEEKKEEKAENAEDEEEKKKKEEEDKKSNALFESIANAHFKPIAEERTPDLATDRLNRGKSRYGSN